MCACVRVRVRPHACVYALISVRRKRNTHVDPLPTSQTIEKTCAVLGVPSTRRPRISSARTAPSSRLHRAGIGQKERRARHDSLFRVGCNSAVLQTHTHALSPSLPPSLLLPLPLSFPLSCPLSYVSYRRVSYTLPPFCAFSLQAGNVPTQWRLTGCTWDNRSPG